MDRIRIPNDATYSPVALTDVLVAAPLASRLLLGATVPGRVVQAAALGLYAGSTVRDWVRRMDVRKVTFLEEFGADVRHLEETPDARRREEVALLADALNRSYRRPERTRRQLAVDVDRHLTDYIAGITGQRVETSTEVRSFSLAALVFPFAVGTCDIFSGDVAIFRSTGIFEAHVLAHEFVHRKGYFKELEAQALAYLALRSSDDPLLVQAARAERLHRQLRVLSGDDVETFHALVEESGLRPELRRQLLALRPLPSGYESAVGRVMKVVYEERMRLTGQNGLSDYDRGFTDFLHTFEASGTARQTPPAMP